MDQQTPQTAIDGAEEEAPKPKIRRLKPLGKKKPAASTEGAAIDQDSIGMLTEKLEEMIEQLTDHVAEAKDLELPDTLKKATENLKKRELDLKDLKKISANIAQDASYEPNKNEQAVVSKLLLNIDDAYAKRAFLYSAQIEKAQAERKVAELENESDQSVVLGASGNRVLQKALAGVRAAQVVAPDSGLTLGKVTDSEVLSGLAEAASQPDVNDEQPVVAAGESTPKQINRKQRSEVHSLRISTVDTDNPASMRDQYNNLKQLLENTRELSIPKDGALEKSQLIKDTTALLKEAANDLKSLEKLAKILNKRIDLPLSRSNSEFLEQTKTRVGEFAELHQELEGRYNALVTTYPQKREPAQDPLTKENPSEIELREISAKKRLELAQTRKLLESQVKELSGFSPEKVSAFVEKHWTPIVQESAALMEELHTQKRGTPPRTRARQDIVADQETARDIQKRYIDFGKKAEALGERASDYIEQVKEKIVEIDEAIEDLKAREVNKDKSFLNKGLSQSVISKIDRNILVPIRQGDPAIGAKNKTPLLDQYAEIISSLKSDRHALKAEAKSHLEGDEQDTGDIKTLKELAEIQDIRRTRAEKAAAEQGRGWSSKARKAFIPTGIAAGLAAMGFGGYRYAESQFEPPEPAPNKTGTPTEMAENPILEVAQANPDDFVAKPKNAGEQEPAQSDSNTNEPAAVTTAQASDLLTSINPVAEVTEQDKHVNAKEETRLQDVERSKGYMNRVALYEEAFGNTKKANKFKTPEELVKLFSGGTDYWKRDFVDSMEYAEKDDTERSRIPKAFMHTYDKDKGEGITSIVYDDDFNALVQVTTKNGGKANLLQINNSVGNIKLVPASEEAYLDDLIKDMSFNYDLRMDPIPNGALVPVADGKIMGVTEPLLDKTGEPIRNRDGVEKKILHPVYVDPEVTIYQFVRNDHRRMEPNPNDRYHSPSDALTIEYGSEIPRHLHTLNGNLKIDITHTNPVRPIRENPKFEAWRKSGNIHPLNQDGRYATRLDAQAQITLGAKDRNHITILTRPEHIHNMLSKTIAEVGVGADGSGRRINVDKPGTTVGANITLGGSAPGFGQFLGISASLDGTNLMGEVRGVLQNRKGDDLGTMVINDGTHQTSVNLGRGNNLIIPKPGDADNINPNLHADVLGQTLLWLRQEVDKNGIGNRAVDLQRLGVGTYTTGHFGADDPINNRMNNHPDRDAVQGMAATAIANMSRTPRGSEQNVRGR